MGRIIGLALVVSALVGVMVLYATYRGQQQDDDVTGVTACVADPQTLTCPTPTP